MIARRLGDKTTGGPDLRRPPGRRLYSCTWACTKTPESQETKQGKNFTNHEQTQTPQLCVTKLLLTFTKEYSPQAGSAPLPVGPRLGTLENARRPEDSSASMSPDNLLLPWSV